MARMGKAYSRFSRPSERSPDERSNIRGNWGRLSRCSRMSRSLSSGGASRRPVGSSGLHDIFAKTKPKRKHPMPLLENHIAVVTGAGFGIGRAIASGYAREGAQVVLLDINEKAAADGAREIRDAGGKAESFG